MRTRIGLVVGFGAGYYLGAMAGRERYEQLNRLARKVKRSETFDTVTDKAKAVVDLGVERARDVIDKRSDHDETNPTNGSTPRMAATSAPTFSGPTMSGGPTASGPVPGPRQPGAF